MTETSMQWSLAEADREQAATPAQQRTLLLPVSFSLLLHGAIVAALLLSANESGKSPLLSAVRINLLPDNPLSLSAPAIPSMEFTQSVLPAIAETPPTNPVEAVPPELPSAPVAIEEVVVDTVAEAPEQSIEQSPVQSPVRPREQPITDRGPQITPPSLLSVQQSIQALDADADVGGWLYECNRLEEESGVRKCAQDSTADEQAAYERATSNVYYENLNPVQQRSRTERSLRTIYQNTGNIAAALDTTEIPDALAGYVLDELAASTSALTNNGTDRVQHMRRMVDRSAAAQQAERVLADPWVQSRAEELRQRNVHSN